MTKEEKRDFDRFAKFQAEAMKYIARYDFDDLISLYLEAKTGNSGLTWEDGLPIQLVEDFDKALRDFIANYNSKKIIEGISPSED